MLKNHFHATLKFTHGEMKVEGTIIFVLASIADLEKRDGWVSTIRSPELDENLKSFRESCEKRDALQLKVGGTYQNELNENFTITGLVEEGSYSYKKGLRFISRSNGGYSEYREDGTFNLNGKPSCFDLVKSV